MANRPYYHRALFTALLALYWLGTPTQVMARAIKAENSYVVLQLPESFQPQSRFAGFFSKDAGATIMVLDLPKSAYHSFTNRFDKELEKIGYSEVRRGKLPGRRDEHLFFYARQHTPVGQFDKYLLIFRNDMRTAYVTITVNPIEKVETPLSYIEAQNILAAVTLSATPSAKSKTYDLSYLGAFKEHTRVVGTTTIYMIDQQHRRPEAKPTKTSRPMFVVAPSLSKQKLGDLEPIGRTLMSKFSRFRNMKLQADEELMVDGMKGYGLSGTAINKSNDEHVGVYQLILANPKGGYFRLVGVAPKNRFSRYLLEFRRMAASFRRTAQ